MSIWLGIKVFGDICLYFSMITAFPALFGTDIFFVWPCLLCGLGVALADMIGNTKYARYGCVCVLFPLASFLLAQDLIAALVLIPPVAYSGVLILRNHNQLEYYGFRQFLRYSMTAWCIAYLVICLLSYFELSTQPWRETMEYRTPAVCGLIYMLCGVLMLRHLRMGEESRGGLRNGGQIALVLGAIGAFLVGLVAAERFLQHHATSILHVIKRALVVFFTVPLTVIADLIRSGLSGTIELIQEPPQNQVQYTEPPIEGGGIPPSLGQAVEQTEQTGFPWLLVIVLLILLTTVLAGMIVLMGKRQSVPNTASAEKRIPTSRKKLQQDRGNRAKVRSIFRKFLRLQRGRGLKLSKHLTSADILELLPKQTDLPAAAKLREVYLAARYDYTRQISGQDVAIAQAALQSFRKDMGETQ